jgi:hypothetical protein
MSVTLAAFTTLARGLFRQVADLYHERLSDARLLAPAPAW